VGAGSLVAADDCLSHPRKSPNNGRHQNPVPVRESSWKKSSQRGGGGYSSL